jgi:P-type E1-E2 ATPase
MLAPIPPLSLPSLPPFSPFQAKATVKRDGKWSNIDAAEVVPGDLVLLACGSAIPADSRINEGQIEVDQAALTGESLPVTMYKVRYAWDV